MRTWPEVIRGPRYEQVEDRLWEVCEPYSIETPYGLFRIPAGFRFDLASVPRAAWTVVGAPFEFGRAAPILHDLLYHYGGCVPFAMLEPWRAFTRGDADRLFWDTMTAEKIPFFRRRLGYWAVKMFGGIAWAKRTKGQGRKR